MRRYTIGLVVLSFVAVGAYTVFAGGEWCSTPSDQAGASSAGATGATCESPANKVAGQFDPAMSGVCRFGCATKLDYESKDVMPQPGAEAGQLTQCPVSGVVFAVDADRPHVRIGNEEFVTCCDTCADKLEMNPRHYLKA